MNLAKVAALLVVVGMTALPFVSCGPVQIKGHEILRNEPPDVDPADLMGGIGKGIGEAFKGLGQGLSGAGKDGPKPERPEGGDASGGGASEKAFPADLGLSSETKAAKKERIFDGDDRWLHFLYIGVFVLAILGFLAPAGSRALALLGALGIGGTVLFLVKFESMLGKGSGEPLGKVSLSWEMGAYLTLAGFAGLLMAGLGWLRLPATTAAAPTAPP